MTHQQHHNAFEDAMELLNENGFDSFAEIFRLLLNEAMKIERSQALAAKPYQRCDDRKGYANGYKPRTIDTRVGRIKVDVPQVRGDVDFYPSALDQGSRSERALKLAIAEMYVKGISTRKVTAILEKMCGLEISSSQVSRTAKLLDEQLSRWRQRPLGQYHYLILDAHYEKVRESGTVRSCALFTAIAVDTKGKREIIGTSVSLSEAEVHWRAFLESLQKRGLHGISYIVSDNHKGLRAALNACMSNVPWQRCQFHLQQNASAYVPKVSMRTKVADDIREIFNARDLQTAQEYLKHCIEKYNESAPKLAGWLEENIPEGLTAFQLPKAHQKRMRTTNMLERHHKEINRRTRVAGIFPNSDSLLRLTSSIQMELSEEWLTTKCYLNMNVETEEKAKTANSRKNEIYRNNVA